MIDPRSLRAAGIWKIGEKYDVVYGWICDFPEFFIVWNDGNG
jgi:hypothetical protein